MQLLWCDRRSLYLLCVVDFILQLLKENETMKHLCKFWMQVIHWSKNKTLEMIMVIVSWGVLPSFSIVSHHFDSLLWVHPLECGKTQNGVGWACVTRMHVEGGWIHVSILMDIYINSIFDHMDTNERGELSTTMNIPMSVGLNIRVELTWSKTPGSSPKSSWRLPTNTLNISYRKKK